MAGENIFADEWRECLRAHYMHVIRTQDRVTEPSLRVVMHEAGFNDSELAELRVRATMHVDDVGADFVPDMAVLEAVEEAGSSFPGVTVTPSVPDSVSVPPLIAPDEATPEEIEQPEAFVEGETEQPEALVEDEDDVLETLPDPDT
ncbi:MAG: hypothetical protein K8I60_15205, partial [Anaerolineae bacterium]|nr:hypothetical protein [Anaerolineae bacterium]